MITFRQRARLEAIACEHADQVLDNLRGSADDGGARTPDELRVYVLAFLRRIMSEEGVAADDLVDDQSAEGAA